MLRNLKIFLLVILAIVLYFHWTDGLKQARENGRNISFWQFAKEDSLNRIDATQKFVNDLPSMFSDAVQSDDKVKRGAINKLADVMEIYKAENDRYPETAEKIVGDIVGSQVKVIEEKGFSYTVTEDGQHFKLSIPMKNGELYTVER